MNLRKQQKEILNSISVNQDILNENIDSFFDLNNVQVTDFHIEIKSDEDNLSLNLKMNSNKEFEISFDIFNLGNTENQKISLNLSAPSLYSWSSDLFDEDEEIKVNEYFENNQTIFKLGKNIKENLPKSKHLLKDILDTQNTLNKLDKDLKENKKNIELNIEDDFLNQVKNDFEIADDEKAKEIFDAIDFYYDETFYIIKVETYTDKDGVFLRFARSSIEIENSGRLSCKYDDSRIAKKDIQSKFVGSLIFEDELDQNFESVVKKLGIPTPKKNQKTLNILYDDYFDMIEKNKKSDAVVFLENKKKSVLNEITSDLNHSKSNKKKLGLYSFK